MTWWFPVPNVTWAGRGYDPSVPHLGVDFAPLPVGSPVICTHAGTVVQANFEAGGFGNVVVVRHEDTDTGKGSWRSLYAHLDSIAARAGDYIAQGDLVGLSGNTGGSTGPHLHFQIMDGGGTNSQNTIDPMTVLTDPTPVPPPVPTPPKENAMLVSQTDGHGEIFIVSADGKRLLGGPEANAWIAAGYSPVPMTGADLTAVPNITPPGFPPGSQVLHIKLEGTATP